MSLSCEGSEKSMDMTGTQHIEAPRDVVWAALNDV